MPGCIVGECDYCDMPVDETDWDDGILLTYNVFVHEWCTKKFKQGQRRNGYIQSLEFENKAMRELLINNNLINELEEMKFLLKPDKLIKEEQHEI